MLRTLCYLSLIAIGVGVTSLTPASAAPPEPEFDAVVSVSRDYVVRYNGRQMPNLQALMHEISTDASAQPDLTVMVRASERLDQKYVMMLMQILDQSGVFPTLDTEENYKDGLL